MSDGQWGGYREPSNPAAVSGPGALSARTDGSAAGPPPMQSSSTPSGPTGDMMVSSGSGASRDSVTPLDAPSSRPDEPVTAGAEIGPGIGPGSAGIRPVVSIDQAELQPIIYRLDVLANLPSSTAQTRAWVRDLKGRLGTRN